MATEKDKRQAEACDRLAFALLEASASNRDRTRDTWELRPRFLDDYLLIFLAGGQGRMSLDGRFSELRAGRLYVRRPGERVGAEAWDLDGRGVYLIRFRVFELEPDLSGARTADGSILPSVREWNPRSSLTAELLCEEIVRTWDAEDALERFGSRIRLQELIRLVLSDHREAREEEETRLEAVKAYIEQHHARKLSLDELAGVARLSVRHFMRSFKLRYGCSAMDYLTAYRIGRAQSLMRIESGRRIPDIAQHVGFKDEAYFRRKFKQVSGIPPAAFMRNARQKIAAYHPEAIGVLLALHLVPAAAPARHPWTDYYRRKYATEQVLPLVDDLPRRLRQLQEAPPDHIVVCEGRLEPAEYSALSALAPLSEIPARTDWRTSLRRIAERLECAGAAEAWLERYERKAGFFRKPIAERLGDTRLLVLRSEGGRLILPGRYSIASVFYDDLLIRPPAEWARAEKDTEIAAEELAQWGIDRILMIVAQDEASQNGWRRIARTAAWKTIEAVRSERVDGFPDDLLGEYTAFAHDLVLDEVLTIWRDRA